MPAKLTYVMEFVADMDRAVRFYRDTVGLTLRFESPQWSEFATGDTRFALHPASEANRAGTVQLGFGVDDLNDFHAAMVAKGVRFPVPPKAQDYGGTLAQFEDCEGAVATVSGR